MFAPPPETGAQIIILIINEKPKQNGLAKADLYLYDKYYNYDFYSF
jgi:hypothetical protein